MPNLIRLIPDLRDQILNVVSILSQEHNWGLNFVKAEEAWKHNKGENVKVAILDTGWYPHKDLVANLHHGFDATGNNDYVDNSNGHGVHVAGIIAASPPAGAFGVTGIAPSAKLIPIKVLDNAGNGSYDFVRQGLEIVKNIDADVVNMSLGSNMTPEGAGIHEIIKDIVSQGKIIVCAAGNDGGSVNYPAKYDETIAVAAIQNDGRIARFSSRGPELDTAAPGVRIYSTWINNQYVTLDGTSMAAPCISGIVALIVSWQKSTGKQSEINYLNMIKILQELGTKDEMRRVVSAGEYDISVPEFCNMKWS